MVTTSAVEPLTADQLAPIVTAAQARWVGSGLIDGAGAALDRITVEIGELPDGALARFENGVITIDADAAGRGWFVDTTPMDDGEYEGETLAQLLAAALGSEAEGKVDLLTVVMHEMGHALRLDDVPTSQSTRLMTE